MEHRLNSPWNIAADFNIDMSFSAEEIAGMLQEYEKDYQKIWEYVDSNVLRWEKDCF